MGCFYVQKESCLGSDAHDLWAGTAAWPVPEIGILVLRRGGGGDRGGIFHHATKVVGINLVLPSYRLMLITMEEWFNGIAV